MYLAPELVERVLGAVRVNLPEGVEVRRVGKRRMRVSHRSELFQRAGMTATVFGNLSRGWAPEKSVATALALVLTDLSSFLKTQDLRWPGHTWGPVTVETRVADGLVYATVVDVEGHASEFGPVDPDLSRTG